jgi:transcriptional regulator with XRE-family HTH domain
MFFQRNNALLVNVKHFYPLFLVIRQHLFYARKKKTNRGLTMEIGQRLKVRRKELDLTQDYVASVLGITRQTMSNWENGRSYPDIERIIRLSDIYKLSLDELLKGDQEMVKHLQESTVVNHFLKNFYCDALYQWLIDGGPTFYPLYE